MGYRWIIMPLPCSVKIVPSVLGLDPLKCEGLDAAAAEFATSSTLNCADEQNTTA